MSLEDVNDAVYKYEKRVTDITGHSIPRSIKEKIIQAWGADGRVSTSGVELVTSGQNYSDFSDKECFIAAVASSLIRVLNEYQEMVKNLYESISSAGHTFKDDFQDKKNMKNQPLLWSKLESAISQSPLNEQEQKNLIGFIIDPDSFGGCKGIGRDDFYTPAVCRSSIQLTVTHHSRIARLADKFVHNLSLVDELTRLAFSVGPEDKDLSSLIDVFHRDLLVSNLSMTKTLPLTISSALHAKPFLLFTGLSGSGKTKLAQAFSKWICVDQSQYELIAVGADWTSNENLLGYPDALNPQQYRKPDNGALDLILRAQENPTLPYFLILDEMNLSHVERYFADFLSAMESGEPVSLHDDTGADWGDEGTVKVPAKLSIPKNLFVIGTVNVDETTYMFSPKVLDRANVIEFRVSESEMESFLAHPVKPDLDAIAGHGQQYAKAFVSSATQMDVALDEGLRKQVSAVLMKFFPELKKAGAEFGYRTAHEICRFIYFHQELSGAETWSIESAMDAAIMQKLLPKLHGSKKKLGPVLAALIRLCLKEGARPENDPIKDEVLTKENAVYPSALEKLARMRTRLNEHGFTSFAEA